MNLLPTRCLVFRTVALAIAFVGMGTNISHAQTKPTLDLSYLPTEAVGAAFVFPQQLLAMPELELIPTEVMQAAGIKEIGFDPLTITQVLAFIAPPTGPRPPEFGFIVHCSQPVMFNEEFQKGFDAKQSSGQKYLAAKEPDGPSVCVVNETTILIAPEPTLLKIMANNSTASPLRTLLASAETTNNAMAIVAIDPIRDLIKQGLSQLPPLPPPFRPLLTIPDLTHTVKLKVNYMAPAEGTTQFSGLQLQGTDAEAAEKLETILTDAVEIGRQMFLAQMRQQSQAGDPNDPVNQATQQYMIRLSESIARRLQPTRDGDIVSVGFEGEIGASMATTPVLIALLLPAVQSARTAARTTQSRNNLKQMAIGMHNFHDVHSHFPARASGTATKPLLSWRVHILPYIDEFGLYERFHLDEAWDSPHNKELIKEMPATYLNPLYGEIEGFKTTYLAPIGDDTIFQKQLPSPFNQVKGTRIRDISDGSSNTIMLLESNEENAVIWTKPDDLEIDDDDPLAGVSDANPGTFNAAMCDGSVIPLPLEISPEDFKAMLTRSGGEIVNPR